MAPRFVEVTDHVEEATNRFWVVWNSLSTLKLPGLPDWAEDWTNETYHIVVTSWTSAVNSSVYSKLHGCVAPVQDVPPPQGATLWILVAAFVTAVVRYAVVTYRSRSILSVYGQTRELKKDL